MTHRFFVPSPTGYAVDQTIALPPELAQQLRQVLRLQPGAQIVVLDNRGWEYDVALAALHRGGGSGVVVAARPNAHEPQAHLTLFMSLLKRDNFEWVLQKGTELGVSRFVPVLTQRTVVTAVKANKLSRWQRIVQEAAEQCRRGRLPELADVVDWATAVAQASQAAAALIPWEEAAGGQTIAAALATAVPTAALLIGPEGGFEASEVAQAAAAGIQPVTLGSRILRAETAAITASALVMSALGEMA